MKNEYTINGETAVVKLPRHDGTSLDMGPNSRNRTSGIRGVRLHKPGRWRASISFQGKAFHLDPDNPLNTAEVKYA